MLFEFEFDAAQPKLAGSSVQQAFGESRVRLKLASLNLVEHPFELFGTRGTRAQTLREFVPAIFTPCQKPKRSRL